LAGATAIHSVKGLASCSSQARLLKEPTEIHELTQQRLRNMEKKRLACQVILLILPSAAKITQEKQSAFLPASSPLYLELCFTTSNDKKMRYQYYSLHIYYTF